MLWKVLSLFLLYITSVALPPIYSHVYSLYHNSKVWRKIKGRWILITDSTTEIGEAFCHILADQNYKLIITDKDEDKLAIQKLDLEKKTVVLAYKVNFETCTNFDFLEKHDIGLLINKIGFFESPSVNYGDSDTRGIIDKHLKGTLLLTCTVVKNMKQHLSGYIVNIGFGFNNRIPKIYVPTCIAVTSAIKIWTSNTYSKLLNDGINAEFMASGFVSSEYNRQKPTFFVPTAKTFAMSVLAVLGNSNHSLPYFPHLLQWIAVRMVPIFIVGRFYKGYLNQYFK